MIPSKIYSFVFLFLGFAMLYWAVVLSVSTFSENKGEKWWTFFPAVQAKINFYQDKFWTKTYSSSGSSFWSSPEYYNQSFGEVQVRYTQEPGAGPFQNPINVQRSIVANIVVNFSTESH